MTEERVSGAEAVSENCVTNPVRKPIPTSHQYDPEGSGGPGANHTQVSPKIVTEGAASTLLRI